MTTTPLRLVDHTAPQAAGVTTEVLTVSVLLSMPAVWTAVVDRELPLQVLLERFLIVLLTCALLAELVRRLGEGGALSSALAGTDKARDEAEESSARSGAVASSAAPLMDAPAQEFGELAGFDEAPLALEPPLDDPVAIAPTDDLGGFDLDSIDLAPLDLDAEPFPS